MIMRRRQWSWILLFGVIINLSFCQQCTTKFNLDNILQDQIVIQPVSQNQGVFQTQQYFYPRTFFSATPKIISCIQSYQVSSFSEINYQLNAVVSRSFVTFTFTADNMNWTYLKVKFWLTSRVDLLVGLFTLENINPSSSSSFDIAIPPTFNPFINQKSIQLNYITGLKATTNNNLYEIDVKNTGRSQDNTIFKVTVHALGQTTIALIQVSYTIFNFQLSFFASGGGQINYLPISGPEYKKIHGSFAPIIYEIQGFDKIRLSKSDRLILDFVFDADFVLETYTGNKFEELGVVYLSIGAQPDGVCSCNQFIMKGGCVDECPPITYPFINYAKGGKSCLTCSPKLNETINQFNTGCVCLQGLQRVDEYCIPRSTQVTSCLADNTVLSNGNCVCIAGTQSVNGNCQSICKVNQNYNPQTQSCQCNFGYFNISGVCGLCSSDKIYNPNFLACVCPPFQFIADNGICQCIPNYFSFQGACVRTCPAGYIRVNNTCTIENITCAQNQIVQNGKCVCSSTTYLVNGTCTTCPRQSYYNATSQTCILCLANCDVCFNFSSCSACKKDYYYNQTSNTCQLNRVCLDNQVLSNGICQCTGNTVEVNGVCTLCLAGTFYNSVTRNCQNCVLNCLSCKNSISCDTCLPNYNFNSVIGFCAPICGANETLVNAKCQCIGDTYRVNGICTKCFSNQFYDATTGNCAPCMLNCLNCTSALFCDRCINTHFFNPVSNVCEPSNCPINQTIINGNCNCVEGTYKINGTCSVCKTDQFYDNITQICKMCTENCNKCSNLLQCAECEPYFDLINGECRFNLYDLKQGYPQFTQQVIITDFASSEPQRARKLSPQELEQIVEIKFEPTENTPSQTIIQQNPNNVSEIRVIFSYCGYIPLDETNATYTFNDPTISIREDIQVVNYNVMDKGITNYLAS